MWADSWFWAVLLQGFNSFFIYVMHFAQSGQSPGIPDLLTYPIRTLRYSLKEKWVKSLEEKRLKISYPLTMWADSWFWAVFLQGFNSFFIYVMHFAQSGQSPGIPDLLTYPIRTLRYSLKEKWVKSLEEKRLKISYPLTWRTFFKGTEFLLTYPVKIKKGKHTKN